MRPTEKARQALNQILASFAAETIPEALAHTVIPPLPVPCAKWSLNNRLLTVFEPQLDEKVL